MSKKRKVAALALSTEPAGRAASEGTAPPTASPSSLPFDGGHLERFWDLASLNEKKRRVAARAVVDVLAAEPEDDELYQRQVEYTLKRLVRGLASPRDMARHGYCLALTELLCTYEAIEPTRVVDMMVSTMSVSSNMKGDESRDVFFGRVFGCMALIRCGRLAGEAARRVAEMLAHAAAKKVFLGEICVELIGELAKQRGFKSFEAELLPEICDLLAETGNVDSVCLVARLRALFPDERPASDCPPVWNSSPLTHPKNLQTVAEALKNSTTNHPRVHSVWGHVLADLGGDDAPHLPTLWNSIVEEGLLTSTHERRYLAFELFAQLAPRVAGRAVAAQEEGGPTTMLGVLLSQRFVKCLANNLSNESNYLFKAAQKCAAAIHTVAKVDDGGIVRLDVVKSLVRSVRDFDRLSGTHLVQEEVALLSDESAQAYRSYLYGVFESAGEETMNGASKDDESDSGSDSDDETPASAAELTQQWAVGQLFVMGKLHRDKEELQLSLLLFLLTHGFYTLPANLSAKGCKKLRELLAKQTGMANAPSSLSSSVRQLCRLRFYSLLQEYSSRVAKRDGPDDEGSSERKAQMGGTMDCGDFWATRAVRFGEAMLASSKDVELFKPLGEQAKEADDEAVAALAEIKEAKAAATAAEDDDAQAALHRRLSGFEYLLVSMRLQLLDEPEETTEILNDVVQCYQNSRGDDEEEKAAGDENSDEEGPADPVTVLVDCMLSLLTRPSALVREVVGTVFRAFTADVGEAALDLLVHALQATAGEEEEDDEEIEDIDDLPEIGMESSSDEEDAAGDDDAKKTGAKDDEQDDEDEDEEEMEGTIGPAVIDSDEDMWDEEEDEDLDDGEMFKQGFNEKLAQILRLKKEQGKKTIEDKRRANAHWKLRILDLLEIFIKKEPRSELLLLLPMPLLECIQAPSVFKEELAAADRCSGILMKLARAKEVPQCKAGRTGAQLAESVEAKLKELLEHLQRTPVPMKLAVASAGYFVRVRGGGEAGDRDAKVSRALGPIFSEAYLRSLQKRSCRLQPKFFGELAQRAGPWLPAAFLSLLVPATSEATIASSYLRAEATALFQKLLSLLSKEDLAAKPTAACLAPLTNVFLGALTSAKDDARRAKQALTLGHSIVAFAGKLPGAALKPKAVTALWGPDGTVRTDLSSAGKSYIEEPSVGAQCTRMLTSIKQVFDGEQPESESAAEVKAREKKRLKDERRAKRAAKAAAQEERKRKREEESGAAADSSSNGHANGADPKGKKKKNKKKKKDQREEENDDDDDDDDAPFAVEEAAVVLDEDEAEGGAGAGDDDDVENDPAYQEFLKQVAIEEGRADKESAGKKKRRK